MPRGRHIKPLGKHVKPEPIMEPNKYARCSVDDGPLDWREGEGVLICDYCQREYPFTMGRFGSTANA